MKHELASEKLLDLAYGELPPREARDVEAHVAGCEPCREELARIRETRSLMALLPVEPPPERGEGIVMAAARQAAEARATKRPFLLPPWLWAGSIGVFAVAAVAVVSWQLGKTAPSDALRDRGGDLMGAPKPAELASAPAPASPAVEEKGAVASEVAKAAPAQPPPTEQRAVEKRKGAEQERTLRLAKREALAAGAPAAPEGGSSIGFGGSKADLATGGAGRGAGMAEATPPSPPPAPAPAPRNFWSPPAESAPQPLQDAAPSAPRRAAAAPRPSVAMEEHDQAAEAYAEPSSRAEKEATAAPAPAARAPEKKRAVAQGAPSAAPEPIGAGAVETRSFPFCPGERRRVVERDADGRVIRYLRETEPWPIEHRFGPDGRLVAAYELVAAARRALPLDAPGLVRNARDAGIDAPPRCSLP